LLSAGTAAAGLAQMNAISNLAGFGTTYLLGYIKNATGSYPIAMLPLVGLAAAGALTILLVGRSQNASKVAEPTVAIASPIVNK
jgi:nitrate/nitrite transporter NarK